MKDIIVDRIVLPVFNTISEFFEGVRRPKWMPRVRPDSSIGKLNRSIGDFIVDRMILPVSDMIFAVLGWVMRRLWTPGKPVKQARDDEESQARIGKLLGLIKDLTGSSKKMLWTVLGVYVYSATTVLTMSSGDILEQNEIVLPVIGMSVPFGAFFYVTPFLLVLLYLYFYSFLKQLTGYIDQLPNKRHWEIAPWIVTRDYTTKSKWNDYRAGLVDIAIFHSLPVTLWALSFFSLQIQDFWLSWWGNLMLLVGILAAFATRVRQYEVRNFRGELRVRWGVMTKAIYLGLFFCFGVNCVALTQFYRESEGMYISRPFSINHSHKVYDTPKENATPSLVASGRSLRWANFQHAIIPNFICDECDLRHADFRQAVIINGSFKGADLEYANLQGAILINCRFDAATLSNADFTDADLTNSVLVAAFINGALFVHTNLAGVDFDLNTAGTVESFSLSYNWKDKALEKQLREWSKQENKKLFSKRPVVYER